MLCKPYKVNGLGLRQRTAPGPLRTLQEPVAELRAEMWGPHPQDFAETASAAFCTCPICTNLCPHGHPRLYTGELSEDPTAWCGWTEELGADGSARGVPCRDCETDATSGRRVLRATPFAGLGAKLSSAA